MNELKSKLFLLGADAPDSDFDSVQKLEVDLNALNKSTKLPEGMPIGVFDSLLCIKALAESVEEYVGVSIDFYFVPNEVLYVQNLHNLDGTTNHSQLSVDSSLLLAALLLSCSPCADGCQELKTSSIPLDRLTVRDDVFDSVTKAYVVEVRYYSEDASTLDCTRAVYLIAKDAELLRFNVLGSFNIEENRFEDFDGVVIEVSDLALNTAKRMDWMKNGSGCVQDKNGG